MIFKRVPALAFSSLLLLSVAAVSAPAAVKRLERVSVSSAGDQGNDSSGGVSAASAQSVRLSADGRYVAFTSAASNLVPGDTNGVSDVFVRDRVTGATERVS